MKYAFGLAVFCIACGSSEGGGEARKRGGEPGPVAFEVHGDEVGDISLHGDTWVNVYQADDRVSIDWAELESASDDGQFGVYLILPTTSDSIEMTGSYSLAWGRDNDNQVGMLVDGIHYISGTGSLQLEQAGQEVSGSFEAEIFDYESEGPRTQVSGELTGPWGYTCWIHTTPDQSGIVESSAPFWTLDPHGESEFCQSLPR
jgi:hypothetical protein